MAMQFVAINFIAPGVNVIFLLTINRLLLIYSLFSRAFLLHGER